MKNLVFKVVAVVVSLIAMVPTVMFAQGGPGFGGGVDDGGGVCVPLDGGLSLLAAAGVGYGIKKYHDFRKQPRETEK